MGCFTCPCFALVQWRTTEGSNVRCSIYYIFLAAIDYSCSEDLNILVKRHIQAAVAAAPSRALATLENDAAELIAQGMVTLNAKLKGVEDEKLVARVVEIWGFFWDQVLTYLEGVCDQLASCFGCLLKDLLRFCFLFKQIHYSRPYTVLPSPREQLHLVVKTYQYHHHPPQLRHNTSMLEEWL